MPTLSTHLRQENSRHFSPHLHITSYYSAFILHSAACSTSICITRVSHCIMQTVTMVQYSYGQPVCYVPYDQHHNDRAIDRVATIFKSSISLWIQSTDKSVRAVMNPGNSRNSTQLSHTKALPTVTLVRNQRIRRYVEKANGKL